MRGRVCIKLLEIIYVNHGDLCKSRLVMIFKSMKLDFHFSITVIQYYPT